MSKRQRIIPISSTYMLRLYPKQQYYGENVQSIVQEIDKDFAMNNNSDEIKNDNYWLYEIQLINVDNVWIREYKRYIRQTTKSIIKRKMMSDNMLIEPK